MKTISFNYKVCILYYLLFRQTDTQNMNNNGVLYDTDITINILCIC